MREHNIDLTALTPLGKAHAEFTEGMLNIWTTHSVTDYHFNLRGECNKRHNVPLPDEYRLPFRIDMTVKLDFPAFILFIGEGHITFASPGDDNRRIEDIAKPSGKPNQDKDSYDNRLPLGEFVELSVTYNRDEMQILIGGEERFYSRKMPYMKQKECENYFPISIVVTKQSTLTVKSITVTELDDDMSVTRGAFKEVKLRTPPEGKPTFESVISELPKAYQNEVQETDSFLKSLRPLKFTRTIDKNGGKITYTAPDFGVSYVIKIFHDRLSHNFGWYIVTNGKPETWHQKADHMQETLELIAISDPLLAARIFYAVNDCIACYGSHCLAKKAYTFNGQTRLSCHGGRVVLRMCNDDFRDVREFFRYANALMERKISNGDALTEKIMLIEKVKKL